MSGTVNILFRGEYWGVGKTWTAISFVNPLRKPKRLIYDGEFRAEPYHSPDGNDYPEKGMFAFDFWHTVYGDNITTSLLKAIKEVVAGTFPYNVLIFDNATIFQDDLDIAMRNKATSVSFVEALGISEKHQNFLQYRFNPRETAAYYFLVKAVIRTLLLQLRKHDVDVIVTTESKNVWKNYGSRDRDNPPTIVGQTAKLWDPWFQMGDILLSLERLEGSREDGTAKLVPYPRARLDTFNPKCSIPGIAPEFIFSDWNVFWKMALKREMPTSEAFAKLEIPMAVTPEYAGLTTIADAKQAIVDHALKVGFIETIGEARVKLAELGESKGLDPSNSLAEYWEWIEAIDGA